MRSKLSLSALVLVLATLPARAGLHYSGEPVADLPSQWRGYLLDQRALRLAAVRPVPPAPANAERIRYEEARRKLEAEAARRPLTADERADLGAVLVRLGEAARAVEVLRAAAREHPFHYRSAANLGTAHQAQGDLAQAAAVLEEAVRLAPGKFVEAEKAQLRLVRLRLREGRERRSAAPELDDLFGVRYVAEGGKYEPGKLDPAERKKLPAEAVATVQMLGLWLPADGRVLWQLAELAAAHGDVRTAAAIMDGCVSEFGLRAPELLRRRQAARAAAEALPVAGADARAVHEAHAAGLKPRSLRPLAGRLALGHLPAVSATGTNALPWAVLQATSLGRRFPPAYPEYLQQLDGKQVALSGFVQPLGEDVEMASFLLIENPVGCWYCEMPDATGMVLVELPAGQTLTYARTPVKVQGRLKLNVKDPEGFLFTISDAAVTKTE